MVRSRLARVLLVGLLVGSRRRALAGAYFGALRRFDAIKNVGSPKGFGLDLAGMRERLARVGGEIESSAGAGTSVFARISTCPPRPTA